MKTLYQLNMIHHALSEYLSLFHHPYKRVFICTSFMNLLVSMIMITCDFSVVQLTFQLFPLVLLDKLSRVRTV